MNSGAKIKKIQKHILNRYVQNSRDLPRRHTTDPYKIRVSEVMLQQTQVERVIPKYLNFLKQFPNLHTLAKADKTQLLTARSGLGYNSRALNIQKAAQHIIQNHEGNFPNDKDTLLQLPGIGPYTAGAICAFAYNHDVIVLDINIKRVLIHMLQLDPNITTKELESVVQQILPKGQARTRYNALMDYGALVLTSKKTGIKSPSQSKFHGSTRRVRGNLIKHLTKYKTVSIQQAKQLFPHEKFDEIIAKMQKEGSIHIKKDNISL